MAARPSPIFLSTVIAVAAAAAAVALFATEHTLLAIALMVVAGFAIVAVASLYSRS